MNLLLDSLLDAESFLPVHKRWAKELIVGYGRLDGRVVGIVANQPKHTGGVLFVDSADKAARFIQTCNAFNVPLLFLADVPGFMIGTAVERQGIIRHGAKMISAVSEATVPKISVVVRKAYGAGLYAMAGPAFEPDCCIALPERLDRRDGPAGGGQRRLLQPDPGDRRRGRAARPSSPRKREEYAEDIDLLHLASELVVDAVIEPGELRADLIKRFADGRRQGSLLRRAAQPGHACLSPSLPFRAWRATSEPRSPAASPAPSASRSSRSWSTRPTRSSTFDAVVLGHFAERGSRTGSVRGGHRPARRPRCSAAPAGDCVRDRPEAPPSPRAALASLFVVAGANLTTQLFKALLAHPRFQALLGAEQISANSFPSGHTTASRLDRDRLPLRRPARVAPGRSR